jgi:hypothetical protein
MRSFCSEKTTGEVYIAPRSDDEALAQAGVRPLERELDRVDTLLGAIK